MTMALPAAFLSEDQFTCSICLEVFNNPVSTPCGHSFCQACISSYWNGDGGAAKSYQCPLCKETFRKRPELHINRTLKEITEQFKQMSSADVRHDGGAGKNSNSHSPLIPRQGEMPESIFTELKSRFQQLQTPGSEQDDLPPPYLPSRRYTLSGPSESSSNLPLCPIHLRGLEYFCRTDNICVCSSCVETAEHRGHSVIPAKREWHIKKSQLGITEVEMKDLICERERKVEEIKNSLQQIQAAAERETDGAVCVFSKLISTVEHCQAEVLEMIEMNRRVAEQRAQSVLRELEEELAELKKRSAEMNQLAVSEDYVLFLKTFPALSILPQAKDWSGVFVSSELTSGMILRTLNQVMEHLQGEMQKLPEVCKSSFRPTVKLDTDITLDPYTSHPRLIISVDGKQVHCGERHQQVPDNPERFDRVVCVLARQGFSIGQHYWEVEVGEKTDWDLGIASHSVNRKGKINVSPAHGYWFLSLRDGTDYTFRTEPSTKLTVNLRPSRIGIFVDCDKGLVSFYNVEARALIYTFTASFPQTIRPFFSPCTNKSGRNGAPLIICPVPVTE
uniref:Bloodthirsty-related gene family, member 1 n=1 Tax=Monopterus albus TaxID=43700 RepID=A0A3Q3KCT9_MONAL